MRRVCVAVVLAAALAAAIPALGQRNHRSSLPSGFPSIWKATTSVLVGLPKSSPGNQVAHVVWILKASNGTAGYLYTSAREHRVAGGTLTCGGKVYHGPYTSSVHNPGEGWFGVPNGGGTAHLLITASVLVGPDSHGPPLCNELRGTWSGTTAPLSGSSGTFTISNAGVLTFR